MALMLIVGTKRAIYAYNNHIIYFDMKRMSSTYCYRLQKYKYKCTNNKFRIIFPNHHRVESLLKEYMTHFLDEENFNYNIDKYINIYRAKYKYGYLLDVAGHTQNNYFKLAVASNHEVFMRKNGRVFNEAANCVFLLDVIKIRICKKSDYCPNKQQLSTKMTLDDVKWLEQDPMIYDNFDEFLSTHNLDIIKEKVVSDDSDTASPIPSPMVLPIGQHMHPMFDPYEIDNDEE